MHFKSLIGLLLALAAFSLTAAFAQAHTTIIAPANASYPYQRWVDAAHVPTVDRGIEVVEATGHCTDPGGSLACTDGSTIWIMVFPGESVEMTFYHELGHAFAFAHPDFRSPLDERFADIYALCAFVPRVFVRHPYSAGEGLIRGTALQRQCEEIRQAARS